MKDQILDLLKENGSVDMETEDSILTIRYQRFYGTEKQFNFELNAKAVDDCKTKVTALTKIQKYLELGFKLV